MFGLGRGDGGGANGWPFEAFWEGLVLSCAWSAAFEAGACGVGKAAGSFDEPAAVA